MKEIQELQKLKECIAEEERTFARLEGQLESYSSRLEEEFSISNLVAGNKLLKKMQGEVSELEIEFTKDLNELKENYEW